MRLSLNAIRPASVQIALNKKDLINFHINKILKI